jgi:hypothetical protein
VTTVDPKATFDPEKVDRLRAFSRQDARRAAWNGSSRQSHWAEGRFAPVPGETEFIPLPDS